MIRILPPAALGLFLLIMPGFTLGQDRAPAQMPLEAVQRLARQVFTSDPFLRKAALEALEQRGNPDVVIVMLGVDAPRRQVRHKAR